MSRRRTGHSQLLLALLIAAALTRQSLATALVTDGSYDPAGNGTVDSSATATPNDLATFRSAVLAANTAGFGGVIHFDEFAANTQITTMEAAYGSKTLNMSLSEPGNLQTFTGATVLSGRALLMPLTDDADDNFTLTVGSITNGIALERVTQFGLTVLSRTGAGYPIDVTITATFSDASTSAATTTLNNSNGGDDTFFGFTAPSGLSISSLTFNPTNDAGDARLIIDDFGFITGAVPEPASIVMLLGGGAILGLRRRRN